MNDHRFAFRQLVYGLGISILALGLSSCSASLFKVKPAVELPALPSATKTAAAGGVRMSVAPLLGDEESQELFEANLPLSGVLPLRVEIAYEPGAAPLVLKKVRLHLRDGEGHEWKLLSTKQAIGRIMKANGVFLYNPYSRKQFEKDFGAYAFDLTTPLPTSEGRRQGFLFFQTPGKSPLSSPSGLVLSIAGLSQPLEIRIS